MRVFLCFCVNCILCVCVYCLPALCVPGPLWCPASHPTLSPSPCSAHCCTGVVATATRAGHAIFVIGSGCRLTCRVPLGPPLASHPPTHTPHPHTTHTHTDHPPSLLSNHDGAYVPIAPCLPACLPACLPYPARARVPLGPAGPA